MPHPDINYDIPNMRPDYINRLAELPMELLQMIIRMSIPKSITYTGHLPGKFSPDNPRIGILPWHEGFTNFIDHYGRPSYTPGRPSYTPGMFSPMNFPFPYPYGDPNQRLANYLQNSAAAQGPSSIMRTGAGTSYPATPQGLAHGMYDLPYATPVMELN